jgi:chemotaxis protein MotB
MNEQLIIIRRGSPEEAQAKGGAWKIAYADFVTAMMAFFLVMWLINAANEKTKAQVASYFNPIKLVDNTTSSKGIKTPGDRTVTANTEQTTGEADKSPEAKMAEKSKTDEANPKPEPAEASDANETQGLGALEDQLLRDPYVMLAQLAGEAAQGAPDGKSEKRFAIVEQSEPGKTGGTAYRDPFDPLAWKSAAQPPPRPSPVEAVKPPEKEKPLRVEQPAKDNTATKEAIAIRNALHDQLNGPGPDLDIKQTKEGVLISLTDNLKFDMFDVGSVKPRREVILLMEKIAAAVRAFPGKIVIRGHTDARRYRNGGNDNWRLSAARAQMAYYMLVRAGVPEGAVERIEGHADRALKNRLEPESAENRRIEILLRVDAP